MKNLFDLFNQGQNFPKSYPDEAYGNSPNLFPLLLSLLSGNNSQFSALSKILSGGDPSVESILSGIKPKKEEPKEIDAPRNDIIL